MRGFKLCRTEVHGYAMHDSSTTSQEWAYESNTFHLLLTSGRIHSPSVTHNKYILLVFLSHFKKCCLKLYDGLEDVTLEVLSLD